MREGATRRHRSRGGTVLTRFGVIGALAMALLPCASARAHLGHLVIRAERYLKIEADDHGVRIIVTLTLGPAEARPVLRAADSDSDGTVTQREADAYMAQWGEGLLTDLPIEVDGAQVDVAWGEAYLDPLGPIRPAPTTVEMVAHVPLEGGTHRVTLRDRMRVEAFDRTDAVFRVRDGARQLACGVGERPSSVVPALAFGPDTQTVTGGAFTSVVEIPGAPSSAPAWSIYVAIGVIVLMSALGVGAVVRRRRRGRPGPTAPSPP